MKEKVVLAYSGGLDTTAIIPWLKEHFNYDVVCCCIDCGQGKELEGLEERAKLSGASKLYIEDLVDDFCDNYIMPCVKANAVYENEYLLGTSMARPAIAKRLVDIARKEGAVAICHGATGKGNDQVRFELAIKAFAPQMDVIAPWRFWELNSREKEIEYAEAHNIPLKITKETNYSKDKNLWHLSHEGLDLEDPAKKVIEVLNKVGGENGCGLLDIVENRLVGMKSRGVYETPGGAILYKAHEKLEEITLDKETQHYKQQLALKFAELVYNGQWYTPLRKAMSAFVDSTQETVTGDVKLKLYKGNIIPASVTSPYTLYSAGMATFDEDDCYNQADSAGFINLFGLPIKVRALNDEVLAAKTGEHFPSVE